MAAGQQALAPPTAGRGANRDDQPRTRVVAEFHLRALLGRTRGRSTLLPVLRAAMLARPSRLPGRPAVREAAPARLGTHGHHVRAIYLLRRPRRWPGVAATLRPAVRRA